MLLNGIVTLNNKAINLKYLPFPFSFLPRKLTSLSGSFINLTVKIEIRQIKTTHLHSGIEQLLKKRRGGQRAAIKQENLLSVM